MKIGFEQERTKHVQPTVVYIDINTFDKWSQKNFCPYHFCFTLAKLKRGQELQNSSGFSDPENMTRQTNLILQYIQFLMVKGASLLTRKTATRRRIIVRVPVLQQ